MRTARSIVERVAFGLLRLAATCMAAAGIALLAAAGSVQAAGSTFAAGDGVEWVRLVAGGSLGFAVVLLVAGGISLSLRRARTTWLPDGPDSQASTGSGFDSWLILFPLTLIVVPTLMLFQLRPLADFWRDVLALADQANFWQDLQRNAAGAGLVLMPIFAALAAPGIETLGATTCVLSSGLLMALLLVRSTRVPRALLLCVILQGGLVLASAVGSAVVERLTPPVERLIRSTPDPGGTEQAQIMAAVERYGAVVRGASMTLAWSWGAIVLWAPLLLLSARGRATFAAVSGPDEPTLGGLASHAPNYSAMEGQARERAYMAAAQQVDRTTRASRWF